MMRRMSYTAFTLALVLVSVYGQNQQIHLTASNNVHQVYSDGNLVAEEPDNGDNWQAVDVVHIDDYTRILAVRAYNLVEGCSGIIGQVQGGPFGYRGTTNGTWKCQSAADDGWEQPGFDDSDWEDAYEIGLNGVIPGCSWIPIAAIGPDAHWIWSEGFIDYDIIMHCRLHIPICDHATFCLNGGTCQVNAPALCRCPPKWQGRFCELELNECDSNPCQNGGLCNQDDDGYHCECGMGFTGVHCETDTTTCASNPCLNGGTCSYDFGEEIYRCSCVPGYTGVHCETDFDECESMPCQNGGTCTDHLNSYSCECVPGFAGLECQIQIDYCTSLPCMFGSTCIPGINSYMCQCHPGYTGVHCETPMGDCMINPCLNGGTCTLGGAGGEVECRCTEGYFGQFCESNVNHCDSGPCRHNGTCVVGDNSYTCVCTPEYYGERCERVNAHCGEVMAQSQYTPLRNFWAMCEINIIDHYEHLQETCRELIRGINHYGDAEEITRLGGTWGCFPTRFPDEMADGACLPGYNPDARLGSCLSCTHMGVCISVPPP